jgi:hypothetical protein
MIDKETSASASKFAGDTGAYLVHKALAGMSAHTSLLFDRSSHHTWLRFPSSSEPAEEDR